MDTPQSLDEQVRRADAERWLASRFIADERARADVIAIYAFDLELARVAQVTHEPMMAEIRLTWWREGVADIFAGRPGRGHPVLVALAEAIGRRSLASAPFEAMVEARFADIDAEPLADEAALSAYADGRAGAALALTLAVLGQADSAALRPAALAWTLAELIETAPQRLPTGLNPDRALTEARSALAMARAAARRVSVEAFPALAHLALVGQRLKGRRLGELEQRARLTLAVLGGRI